MQECNCGNTGALCENLNLTLYKGGIELAKQEFPAVDTNGNDDSINWDIDVDRNMTRFNRSGEEPQLRVEFSKPGQIRELGVNSGCLIVEDLSECTIMNQMLRVMQKFFSLL
jgi:hypothetical protein